MNLMLELSDQVEKEKLPARFTISSRRVDIVELPDTHSCEAAAETCFEASLNKKTKSFVNKRFWNANKRKITNKSNANSEKIKFVTSSVPIE